MAKPLAGVDPNQSASAKERATALIGRTISDRYRIVELVSMGGMGAIYRAEHLLMRKQVAIKVLHPETENFPELVSRFEREAIAGAHLNHPNVASASDFGKFDEDSYFLVLEYIEGITLSDLIRQGPVPALRATNIAKQLAAALGAAHQREIVHRDVKPKNIMVTAVSPNDTAARGQDEIVKLIDFGLAKVPVEKLSTSARDADPENRELTNAGVVMGTIAYMAPETALGMRAVQARADLYSLGVILYEMLTGKHMFDAVDPQKLFAAHCSLTPPPLKERNPNVNVPAGLEAILMRLLEKDPEARYPDADSLIAALDAFKMRADLETGIQASLSPPRPHGPGEYTPLPSAASGAFLQSPHKKRVWRGPWVWAMLAVLLAGGVSLALFLTFAGPSRTGATEGAASGAAEATAPPTTTGSTPAPSATASASATAAAHESPEASAKTLRDATLGGPEKAAASLLALLEEDGKKLGEPAVQSAAATVVEKVAEANLPDIDRVFEALLKQGAPGLDVLYELAGGADGSNATARARAMLAKPEVIARASVPMRVAHDLRNASCQQRTFLAPRAATEGDDRSLMILGAMLPPNCEPRTNQCCFPKHPELEKAVGDIRARLRGGQ